MSKNDLKVYGTAVVGAKGQFVVPSNAREELHLSEGDKLVIVGSASKGFLGVLRADVFQKFLNILHQNMERTMLMTDTLKDFDDFAAQLNVQKPPRESRPPKRAWRERIKKTAKSADQKTGARQRGSGK